MVTAMGKRVIKPRKNIVLIRSMFARDPLKSRIDEKIVSHYEIQAKSFWSQIES